jgi:hypothetical protein
LCRTPRQTQDRNQVTGGGQPVSVDVEHLGFVVVEVAVPEGVVLVAIAGGQGFGCPKLEGLRDADKTRQLPTELQSRRLLGRELLVVADDQLLALWRIACDGWGGSLLGRPLELSSTATMRSSLSSLAP